MDWDEDGDLDLLLGNYLGNIWYYENTGSRKNPKLTTIGKLQIGAADIDVGNNAAPVVVDWNNDGKKDLLVGSQTNPLLLYLNRGTNSSPVFLDEKIIEEISLFYGHPDVADMDNDGKKDIVMGDHNGNIYFYKNIGEDEAPVFDVPRLFDVYGYKVNAEARVEITDWDNDGTLDLLVGSEAGYLTLFHQPRLPTRFEQRDEIVPFNLNLHQNYPNPFNGKTLIPFEVRVAGRISLKIYNPAGEKVKDLLDEMHGPGKYKIGFDAEGLSSGIYIYVLETPSGRDMKKMILMR